MYCIPSLRQVEVIMSKYLDTLSDQDIDCISYDLVKAYGITIIFARTELMLPV